MKQDKQKGLIKILILLLSAFAGFNVIITPDALSPSSYVSPSFDGTSENES